MSNCPHCGQPIMTGWDEFARELGPTSRLIFERIIKSGNNGVEGDRLADYVYGDRPDGGPESAMNSIKSLICRSINRKLAPLGKRISAGRGRKPGIYRLQDIAS